METESIPSEWDRLKASGSDAYSDMVSTLTVSGLLSPPVPRHLVDELMAVEWAWGTTQEIEPWAVYFDAFAILDQCLAPDFEDCWMFGHRGHGINSYGMGLIAKVGGLLVAQQHGYDGVYMAIDESTNIDDANRSWSHLLGVLDTKGGPATVAVLFSDYRGYACILSKDPKDEAHVEETDRGDLSAGWRCVYSADQSFESPTDQLQKLQELRTSGGDLTRLAAAHLWRLLNPGEENETYPNPRAAEIARRRIR